MWGRLPKKALRRMHLENYLKPRQAKLTLRESGKSEEAQEIAPILEPLSHPRQPGCPGWPRKWPKTW